MIKFINQGKPHPLLDAAFKKGLNRIKPNIPPIMEFKSFEQVEKWAKKFGFWTYHEKMPSIYYIYEDDHSHTTPLFSDPDLEKFMGWCDEYRAKEGLF